MKLNFFNLLWHNNYWDGPLTGIGLYRGELVRFDATLHDDDTRTFKLYRLSHEELLDELYWHRKFLMYVGFHCDHDQNYHRLSDGPNPAYQDSADEFYNPYDAWKEQEHEYPDREFIKTITEKELQGKNPVL